MLQGVVLKVIKTKNNMENNKISEELKKLTKQQKICLYFFCVKRVSASKKPGQFLVK